MVGGTISLQKLVILSCLCFVYSRQEEDLKDDADTATPANSARSSRTVYPGDENGDTELEAIMMRAAPGLGKEYGRVDSVKDAVYDENEVHCDHLFQDFILLIKIYTAVHEG